MEQITIRRLGREDLPIFKSLRLESLKAHPDAYGSAYEDAVNDPDTTWLDRVRPSLVGGDSAIFLAFAGSEPAGMTNAWPHKGSKVCHTANITGVYVRPAYRGQGLAERLVREALAWCKTQGYRNVALTATTHNASAIRCYTRCGFTVYGVAPEVIRVGETYHDELLMWRRL